MGFLFLKKLRSEEEKDKERWLGEKDSCAAVFNSCITSFFKLQELLRKEEQKRQPNHGGNFAGKENTSKGRLKPGYKMRHLHLGSPECEGRRLQLALKSGKPNQAPRSWIRVGSDTVKSARVICKKCSIQAEVCQKS